MMHAWSNVPISKLDECVIRFTGRLNSVPIRLHGRLYDRHRLMCVGLAGDRDAYGDGYDVRWDFEEVTWPTTYRGYQLYEDVEFHSSPRVWQCQ